MELTMDDGRGYSYTGRMYKPFDTMFLDQPWIASDFYITKGAIYFIRSEYVESINIVNGESREVRTTLGNHIYDYSLIGWDLFPEDIYNNFLY